MTVSQVSVFELEIFDHLNKGMYPPSGAETASKKKYNYFSLNSVKHGKIRNLVRIKRIFSQFSRKLPFLEKKATYLQRKILYKMLSPLFLFQLHP